MNYNPVQRFHDQAQRTPDLLALYADESELSYRQLLDQVCSLAAALRRVGVGRGSRVGILGTRGLVSIRCLLAISWCGAAYIPLSTRWPAERLESALLRTRLDALAVDEQGRGLLSPGIVGATPLLVSDCPQSDLPQCARSTVAHIDLAALNTPDEVTDPARLGPEDLAYITFTSGTTGTPKGVMVACGSMMAYLDVLAQRKALTETDRAPHFTELSFDPSLGEVFLPLWAGASMHVVPPISHVSPVSFVQERKLTVWGSTPAAIAWLRDTRALQPGSLAGLRYSSFGGEPLTVDSVKAWQAAAPDSVVDNLYGPTEATVDCCGQSVAPGESPVVTQERGILAIGVPHAGSELAVFSADQQTLPDNTVGELAISGVQLTLGYLDQPQLTAARFPVIAGKRWYLTGDLARRDELGYFHHLGRVDNQIKIHGFRVELEDVEAQLRALSGADAVAAVAWPVRDGVAQGIAGFLTNAQLKGAQLRSRLRTKLPAHMVPGKLIELDVMPMNSAGKIDRAALVASLGPGEA